MVVSERLARNTQIFAHVDKYVVARIVEANCGVHYWRRHERHLSLDALEGVTTEDHPDEWMITRLEASRSEVWAAWATATDMRIDIEHIFARLVVKYEGQSEPHRFRYLVALYYVTTQVKLEDAHSSPGSIITICWMITPVPFARMCSRHSVSCTGQDCAGLTSSNADIRHLRCWCWRSIRQIHA
jgi:hypothetical protein